MVYEAAVTGEVASRVEQYRSARSGALAMALLAATLLGGCQKKPGGQVIAVVNNQEITQKELRVEQQSTQLPSGMTEQAATAGLLQRIIDRNLLADYARTEGVDREPEFIARRRLMEQSLLADLAMRKLSAGRKLPSRAEVQAFIAANPTLYANRQKLVLDQIRFPTPRDPKLIAAISPAATMTAVAAQLQASGIAFERGTPTVDTGSIEPALAKLVVRQADGVPFAVSMNGMTLISAIVTRQSAATPPENWIEPATNLVARTALEAALKSKVEDLRKQAKISYDPAFQPVANAPKPTAKPNSTAP